MPTSPDPALTALSPSTLENLSLLLRADRAQFVEQLKSLGMRTVGHRARFELSLRAHHVPDQGAERAIQPAIGRGLSANAVVFITFGDDAYAESRERIAEEARSSGWFDQVRPPYTRVDAERLVKGHTETEHTLRTFKRGGGFWVWKPLIIREALQTMQDGQVRSRSHYKALQPHTLARWAGHLKLSSPTLAGNAPLSTPLCCEHMTPRMCRCSSIPTLVAP